MSDLWLDSKPKEKKNKEKEPKERMLGLDSNEERWESEMCKWCNWALSMGESMNFERLM